MSFDPAHVSIAHLVIDPQNHFMRNMRAKDRDAFTTALRQFADDVVPVPTIWVGFGLNLDRGWRMYPGSLAAENSRGGDIKRYRLTSVTIHPHEDIFIKNHPNAFENPLLALHLRRQYPNLRGLAVTGLYTDMCVAQTIAGAVEHGYNCWGIYDLMRGHKHEFDHDPNYQKNALRNALRLKRGVVLADSRAFIHSLGTNPAMAQAERNDEARSDNSFGFEEFFQEPATSRWGGRFNAALERLDREETSFWDDLTAAYKLDPHRTWREIIFRVENGDMARSQIYRLEGFRRHHQKEFDQYLMSNPEPSDSDNSDQRRPEFTGKRFAQSSYVPGA